MKLPRILVYILLVVAPNVALGEATPLSEIGHKDDAHWLGACRSIYDTKLKSWYDDDEVKKLKPIMYAACTHIKDYDGEEKRLPFWLADFICTIDGDRCKLANKVECWTDSDEDSAATQYSWNEENDNLTVYCSGGNGFSPREYDGCVLIGWKDAGGQRIEQTARDDEKNLCNDENYGEARTNGDEGVDLEEADRTGVSGVSVGTDSGTSGGDTTDSEAPDTSDSSEDSSDNDADSTSDEIIDADSESELSEQKIADLAKNASAMTKTEQSTANKLLGGASIAATGIGGMQLASAIAENRADDAAERDMAAYLATFRCDYGQGRNIMGGETDVQLPGGNNLIELKQQFMELATDLKTRKDALEMTPGIESEVILDSATMGLYDDESLGITDGAYTSLSRALSDPDGADAAEWAQQRSDTKSQLTTGAVMAGVGIVGGVVGNLLINRDAPDEKSDEIIAEYEEKRRELRRKLKEIEDQTREEVTENPPEHEEGKEPDIAGVDLPDIVGCEKGGGTWNGFACICEDRYIWDKGTKQCKMIGIIDIDLPEISTVVEVSRPIAALYGDALFDSGKTAIKDGAKDKLDDTITEMKNTIGADTDFKIIVVGYTDKDRIIQNSSLCRKNRICDNEALGLARANSVVEYIKGKWTDLTDNKIKADSAGDTCATKTNPNSEQKALDRKVQFWVFFDGEEADIEDLCVKPDDE